MIVNMHDADSIIAWWKVWPARHHPALGEWLRILPSTAPAIFEAQRRIATEPELIARMQEARRQLRPAPSRPAWSDERDERDEEMAY